MTTGTLAHENFQQCNINIVASLETMALFIRQITAVIFISPASRSLSLGTCNYAIFLSRRFHRPIYF